MEAKEVGDVDHTVKIIVVSNLDQLGNVFAGVTAPIKLMKIA